jgi:FkbM family methyltransferase
MNDEQHCNRYDETKRRELQLRVLHDILYEATSFPGLVTPYTSFLRSLRERLHPVGVKEIRLAQMNSGLKFQVDLGDRLGCDIYYGYYQEYFDSQLFFSLLDSEAIFLDIGANFGYYAITAAKSIGKKNSVHAFEPNENAYQLLQANVEINGFQETVCTHQICVGAEDGEVDFYVTEESSFSGMSSTGRAKLREKVRVPICCLDSILPQLGLSQIDAIKIDVEGYEFSVLQGAKETLRKSPNLAIAMEVSAKNLDEQRREALVCVLTDIYELGFRGWVVKPTQETLVAIATPQEAANLRSANLFLVVSHSERERRLQKAYADLRVKAFRGLAQQIGLDAETLLGRNPVDPYGYFKLHSALVENLVCDRDLTIAHLNDLMQKRDLTIAHLNDLMQKRDREFNDLMQKRDLTIAHLNDLMQKRDLTIAHLNDLMQKRDRELTQLQEEINRLQEEVILLQEEVNRPLKAKILEKIQQKLKLID